MPVLQTLVILNVFRRQAACKDVVREADRHLEDDGRLARLCWALESGFVRAQVADIEGLPIGVLIWANVLLEIRVLLDHRCRVEEGRL